MCINHQSHAAPAFLICPRHAPPSALKPQHTYQTLHTSHAPPPIDPANAPSQGPPIKTTL
ncbi:hypothetical protein T440DRAFT_462869 [Plenodomus tracheiphilus IPT5]|uniref:Uncharacterized protein n=1 Tax=Plenodomus tracheiphilus IPT5 TaxID=1408161 RepID=A0A6A7BML5_9PLEO|nr:hypothetical protein T440DRAFT_462869 [Plenodomus tracheiphilus IPT5]